MRKEAYLTTRVATKESMWKLIIWIIIIAVYGCASMQIIPEEDRTFSGVFEVAGASKDQIFNATKIWIAENFRSARSVIEYENKEQGTVIGNGIIPYPCSGFGCVSKGKWKVPFTMRVDMKDGKFKLTFTNIMVAWPPYSGHGDPVDQRGELNSIKPKLLSFGDEILASIRRDAKSSEW